MSIRWSVLLLVLGLSLTVGFVVGNLLRPSHAFGSGCGSKLNSEAYNGGGNHYGVGVFNDGMYVTGASAECAHVSSIWVQFDNQNLVEAGWYITASGEDLGDSCAAHTDAPHLLAVSMVNGNYHCQDGAGLTTQQHDSWKLLNSNHDTSWGYEHNDSNYDTKSACTSCMSGTPAINGERHNDTENGSAFFLHMHYLTSDTTWHDWDDADWLFDNDPDYNPICYSDTHVTSEQTTANKCTT